MAATGRALLLFVTCLVTSHPPAMSMFFPRNVNSAPGFPQEPSQPDSTPQDNVIIPFRQIFGAGLDSSSPLDLLDQTDFVGVRRREDFPSSRSTAAGAAAAASQSEIDDEETRQGLEGSRLFSSSTRSEAGSGSQTEPRGERFDRGRGRFSSSASPTGPRREERFDRGRARLTSLFDTDNVRKYSLDAPSTFEKPIDRGSLPDVRSPITLDLNEEELGRVAFANSYGVFPPSRGLNAVADKVRPKVPPPLPSTRPSPLRPSPSPTETRSPTLTPTPNPDPPSSSSSSSSPREPWASEHQRPEEKSEDLLQGELTSSSGSELTDTPSRNQGGIAPPQYDGDTSESLPPAEGNLFPPAPDGESTQGGVLPSIGGGDGDTIKLKASASKKLGDFNSTLNDDDDETAETSPLQGDAFPSRDDKSAEASPVEQREQEFRSPDDEIEETTASRDQHAVGKYDDGGLLATAQSADDGGRHGDDGDGDDEDDDDGAGDYTLGEQDYHKPAGNDQMDADSTAHEERDDLLPVTSGHQSSVTSGHQFSVPSGHQTPSAPQSKGRQPEGNLLRPFALETDPARPQDENRPSSSPAEHNERHQPSLLSQSEEHPPRDETPHETPAGLNGEKLSEARGLASGGISDKRPASPSAKSQDNALFVKNRQDSVKALLDSAPISTNNRSGRNSESSLHSHAGVNGERLSSYRAASAEDTEKGDGKNPAEQLTPARDSSGYEQEQPPPSNYNKNNNNHNNNNNNNSRPISSNEVVNTPEEEKYPQTQGENPNVMLIPIRRQISDNLEREHNDNSALENKAGVQRESSSADKNTEALPTGGVPEGIGQDAFSDLAGDGGVDQQETTRGVVIQGQRVAGGEQGAGHHGQEGRLDRYPDDVHQSGIEEDAMKHRERAEHEFSTGDADTDHVDTPATAAAAAAAAAHSSSHEHDTFLPGNTSSPRTSLTSSRGNTSEGGNTSSHGKTARGAYMEFSQSVLTPETENIVSQTASDFLPADQKAFNNFPSDSQFDGNNNPADEDTVDSIPEDSQTFFKNPPDEIPSNTKSFDEIPSDSERFDETQADLKNFNISQESSDETPLDKTQPHFKNSNAPADSRHSVPSDSRQFTSEPLQPSRPQRKSRIADKSRTMSRIPASPFQVMFGKSLPAAYDQSFGSLFGNLPRPPSQSKALFGRGGGGGGALGSAFMLGRQQPAISGNSLGGEEQEDSNVFDVGSIVNRRSSLRLFDDNK